VDTYIAVKSSTASSKASSKDSSEASKGCVCLQGR
jgi:hypothetical protein